METYMKGPRHWALSLLLLPPVSLKPLRSRGKRLRLRLRLRRGFRATGSYEQLIDLARSEYQWIT